jgi:hypothetical protein
MLHMLYNTSWSAVVIRAHLMCISIGTPLLPRVDIDCAVAETLSSHSELKKKTELHGLNPQANYTDCRLSAK